MAGEKLEWLCTSMQSPPLDLYFTKVVSTVPDNLPSGSLDPWLAGAAESGDFGRQLPVKG